MILVILLVVYLFAALWAGFYGAILSANIEKDERVVK